MSLLILSLLKWRDYLTHQTGVASRIFPVLQLAWSPDDLPDHVETERERAAETGEGVPAQIVHARALSDRVRCASVLPTSAKLVGRLSPYSNEIRWRSATASPARMPESGRQW
jgi:hypothetical protein